MGNGRLGAQIVGVVIPPFHSTIPFHRSIPPNKNTRLTVTTNTMITVVKVNMV